MAAQKDDTENNKQKDAEPLRGEIASDFLSILAWLILLGAFFGTYFIWKEFGTVEVPRYGTTPTKEYNYPAIWYGIAFFFGGIVWFALLKVVVAILKHVVEIRKSLLEGWTLPPESRV